MNTPSHIIVNVALLNHQTAAALPLAIGATLPDLPIFIMFIWARLVRGQPQSQIWQETYYSPFWYGITTALHSIPLALMGAIVCYLCHWLAGAIICVSMVLHDLGDLPVHHDDAHRHFFPFSNYRFISPFSYWDLRHHGRLVMWVERSLVLIATVVLFVEVINPWARLLMVVTNLFYWGIATYFIIKGLVGRNCNQTANANVDNSTGNPTWKGVCTLDQNSGQHE